MKKLLSAILTLSLILTFIPYTTLPANASAVIPSVTDFGGWDTSDGGGFQFWDALDEGDYRYSLLRTGGVSTHAAIRKYNGSGGDIVIPSTLGGYPVAMIGANAFDNHHGDRHKIISVTIPDGVIVIDSSAFMDNFSLRSVSIPNSVAYIGHAAFEDNYSLASVTLPSGLKYIGESAFRASPMTSVTIPNGVTYIGGGAFHTTKLTSVSIPDSVTYLGSLVFEGTPWYHSQPDGFIYLGNWLYEYKGTMPDNTSLTIREGTKGIAGYAFNRTGGGLYSRSWLANITIPNSVTFIGENAFGFCNSLTSITIPDSVTFIGRSAFYGCDSLRSVTIGNGVTFIDERAFMNCTSLTSATIPDGVTHIGTEAFYGCTSLTSVTIPESVTHIGYHAFHIRGANGDDVPLPNVTIRCVADSTAHTYARDNGIKFELITPPSPLDSAASWAREGITAAIAKGFVPTDIQNNYTQNITRAEFCRMAVKWVEYATGKNIDTVLAEQGKSRDPGAFTDTSDPDILAAFALGITSGAGGGLFNPSGQFTREQAATMIMNTVKVIGADVADPPASDFGDMSAAAGWAQNGINFVGANGIMSGSGGNFNPKGTFDRQQSIVTFNNIDPKALP
jgi:hypothetical protein